MPLTTLFPTINCFGARSSDNNEVPTLLAAPRHSNCGAGHAITCCPTNLELQLPPRQSHRSRVRATRENIRPLQIQLQPVQTLSFDTRGRSKMRCRLSARRSSVARDKELFQHVSLFPSLVLDSCRVGRRPPRSPALGEGICARVRLCVWTGDGSDGCGDR